MPIGGVLRQATPPACSDSQPVRVYEDSDDNGFYRCVGTTWTKVADDGDLDGFASSIDADDADDAVYARNLTAAVVKSGEEIGPSGDVILTGTLVYRTDNVTYSGDDAQVNQGTTLKRVVASATDNGNRGHSFAACVSKGHRGVVSWTTAFISGSKVVPNRWSSRLGFLLQNPNTTDDDGDIWSNSSSNFGITSYTCFGFSS